MAHDEESQLIRKYLLRDLPDEELLRIEERLMSDTDFYNLSLVVEDELAEQYARGELSRRERRLFEQSLLSTEAGRQLVNFNRAFYALIPKLAVKPSIPENRPHGSVWSRFFGNPYLQTATAMVVLFAVGFVVWSIWIKRDLVKEGRSALVAAFLHRRPTKARISGFKYAPFTVTRGSDDREQGANRGQLDHAAAVLPYAAQQYKNARALHALGQFYLATGDVDQAIRQLKQTLEIDPGNAEVNSDLGAAYLERATAETPPTAYLLDECLGHLNKAVEVNPVLREALFNRALCYEAQQLWEDAKSDWNGYLQLDSTSEWADEARERLEDIEQRKQRTSWDEEKGFREFETAASNHHDDAAWQILGPSYGTRLSYIIDRLLADVLQASSQGNAAEASSAKQILGYAGRLALTRTGDRLFYDIAMRYSSAPPGELVVLARARDLQSKGLELFGEESFEQAAERFDEAAEEFDQADDVGEAFHARYLKAHCYLRIPRISLARSVFEDLRTAAVNKEHKWLISRADDGLAEVHLTRSEYSKAIEFASEALAIARSISNHTGVARSCAQLAAINLEIGAYEEAEEYVWEALNTVNEHRVASRQASLPYEAAADLFTARKYHDVALAFQLESLRREESSGYLSTTSFAHAHVGRAYGDLKSYSEAFRHLDRAIETADAMLSPTASRDVMSFASLKRADLLREAGRLDEAISGYDITIALNETNERIPELFAARKGRLLSCVALGDIREADRELKRVSEMIDKFAAEITEEKNRTAFSEGQADLHEAAVEFAYSALHDSIRAYEYSEAFRARSLLDLTDRYAVGPHIKGTGAKAMAQREGQDLEMKTLDRGLNLTPRAAPLKLKQVQDQLPGDVQLIQFAVLKQKTLVWVISHDDIRTAEVSISEAELTSRLKNYLRLIVGLADSPNLREESQNLYRLLIDPIENLLARRRQLCIVPDKVLNNFPFASLMSPGAGKYLFEDYVISYAPSSSIFIRCVNRAKEFQTRASETLLNVADPRFDRTKYSLPSLPGAVKEAKAISGLYKKGEPLVGSQATERDVVDRMAISEVIHLATHFVAVEGAPMLSGLLLSADTAAKGGDHKTDGLLQAYELYRLRLPRTKLVVLAACETASEHYYASEGAVGAARPFISAGVPSVVATLWSVGDDVTADLMVEFHKQRKLGRHSTAKALQLAQLKIIKDHRHPYYWAAFWLIGDCLSV